MDTGENLLIHIGYHKTGSTWLQKNLFDRSDRGFYPLALKDAPEPNYAKDVGRKFVYDEQWKYMSSYQFDAVLPELKATLTQGVNWKPEGIPVISNERLVGGLYNAGFDGKEVAERIHQIYPKAKILIVIREQVSMVLSTYYQLLKMGGTISLEQFLDQNYDSRSPNFSFYHFQYHHLLAHYQKLFGPDQVLILPYELFVQDAAAYLQRIGEFCGVEMPEDLEVNKRVNFIFNRYVEYKSRVLNLFLKHHSVNAYSPFYLPGWMRQALIYAKVLWAKTVSEQKVKRFISAKKATIRESMGDQFHESNLISSTLCGFDLSEFGYVQAQKEPVLCES